MPDKKNLPSIERLDEKIKKAKQRVNKDEDTSGVSAGGAARVSVELLAGVIVGLLMGFYLDKWLGTSPILLLICFCLGVAGSALNIYKMFKREYEDDEH